MAARVFLSLSYVDAELVRDVHSRLPIGLAHFYEESFENGLLEYPHYTRPLDFEGLEIPEILRSGHHRKIAAWRQDEARRLTQARRPDLWAKVKEK